MKNSKHYFLTFNLLIFAVMCLSGQVIPRMVLNEIMADPTPVTGLPDAEWIEVFNNSTIPFRLKNWKIIVGTTSKILPDTIIPPGQYGILCSSRVAPELGKFGRTIVLESLPQLRNSGNLVLLKNAENITQDSIDYSDKWYGNPAKREGGWSLERVDPARECGQILNWQASADPSGGTPGRLNSVNMQNTDVTPPQISSASVIHARKVEIRFSEWMDTRTTGKRANYSLSEGYGNPDSLHLTGEETIHLFWEKPLQGNKNHRLSCTNLTDLCGNSLSGNVVDISMIILKEGDLLINEILFDPWPGGADFLEILNHSGQSIPLDKIVVANRDGTGALKSQVSLTEKGAVILPGELMALTTDTLSLNKLYFHRYPRSLTQVSKLPPFNNDQGSVVLLSDSLEVLDEFHYSAEMHHPLLIDPEGVSLERISPEKPATDPLNWHSAAAISGFATPGYANSQYCPQPAGKTKITIQQAYISPNGDALNDELVVQYETPSPGWIMTCQLFDASGRMLRILRSNLLTGISGEFRWNGRDENEDLLPPGPCILNFELFHLSGEKENHRKVLVITK